MMQKIAAPKPAEAQRQRAPAEEQYADELVRLRAHDPAPRPPGWKLSPVGVRAFVLGDPERGVRKKFVGNPSLALGREKVPEVGVPGELHGPPFSLCLELGDVVAETVVQEPEVPGMTRADRELPLSQHERRSRADTPR